MDLNGAEPDRSSVNPAINADGSIVVYRFSARDLVASDTNNHSDIFVVDLDSGITTRVSVSADGSQANDASDSPAISDERGGGHLRVRCAVAIAERYTTRHRRDRDLAR